MPILAALLVSMFGGLLRVFVQYMGMRSAVVAAFLLGSSALAAAMYGAGAALIASLVSTFPDYPGVALGVWLFVPNIAPAAVAACLAADALVAAYSFTYSQMRTAAGG